MITCTNASVAYTDPVTKQSRQRSAHIYRCSLHMYVVLEGIQLSRMHAGSKESIEITFMGTCMIQRVRPVSGACVHESKSLHEMTVAGGRCLRRKTHRRAFAPHPKPRVACHSKGANDTTLHLNDASRLSTISPSAVVPAEHRTAQIAAAACT